MAEKGRALVPRTGAGWVAAALGFSVVAVIVVLLAFGDLLTSGGETMLPIWGRLVVFGVILLFAIPAFVMGRKARAADRSILGTVALVISGVLAVWVTVTGVLSMLFE